jgi:hypothetical protein
MMIIMFTIIHNNNNNNNNSRIKQEFKCVIRLTTMSSPYLLCFNKLVVNQLCQQKRLKSNKDGRREDKHSRFPSQIFCDHHVSSV